MDQQTGRQNTGNHPSWPEKRKRTVKNEDSLRDLLNNIKYINIRTLGVPEKEREKLET